MGSSTPDKSTNSLANNQGLFNLEREAASSNYLRDAVTNYGSGKMSLDQIFNPANATRIKSNASDASLGLLTPGGLAANFGPTLTPEGPAAGSRNSDQIDGAINGFDAGALARALIADPRTATMFAQDQVRSNPMLSGTFGKGGLQDRLGSEEQNLAQRGWSMKPEDTEAYGQASDETARIYGQEENGLAQALASRGLATGASGAAGAAFSGLQGNKSERLAAAQRGIAQQRMEMNRQRLNDVRGQINQTNQTGISAVGQQFAQNNQAGDNWHNAQTGAVQAGQVRQGNSDVQWQQQKSSEGPGLGQVLMGAAGGVGGALLTGTPQGAAVGLQAGTTLGKAIK